MRQELETLKQAISAAEAAPMLAKAQHAQHAVRVAARLLEQIIEELEAIKGAKQ